MIDYLCAKFGDCTFSCFGFIVRSDRQTYSYKNLKQELKTVKVNSEKTDRQNHRITQRRGWSHYSGVSERTLSVNNIEGKIVIDIYQLKEGMEAVYMEKRLNEENDWDNDTFYDKVQGGAVRADWIGA